jgi:hypothetical protein
MSSRDDCTVRMDGLGGNALALMTACCSPASTGVEETLSTLSYATRATDMQYDPKVWVGCVRRKGGRGSCACSIVHMGLGTAAAIEPHRATC